MRGESGGGRAGLSFPSAPDGLGPPSGGAAGCQGVAVGNSESLLCPGRGVAMETEAEAPAGGSLHHPLLDSEQADFCRWGALPGFGEECRLRSVLVEGRASHPPDRPSCQSLAPSGGDTDERADVPGWASGPSCVFGRVPRLSLHPRRRHFHQLAALTLKMHPEPSGSAALPPGRACGAGSSLTLPGWSGV